MGGISVFKHVQRKNELHANSDIVALAKAGSREVYVSMGSHFLLKAHFDRLKTDIPPTCASYSSKTFAAGIDFLTYNSHGNGHEMSVKKRID